MYRQLATTLFIPLALQVQANDQELAKQSQNPVANMISVPFENNMYFDVGPSEEKAYVTNIKPVYPTRINDKLNLINRVVAPVIYLEGQDAVYVDPQDGVEVDAQDDLGGIAVFPGSSNEFGLGNIQYQAFISPSTPGKVIWGAGPVFELPTNTNEALGTDTWSAGPALVVLTMPGKWVLGLLAQNLWSFAEDSGEADVNKAIVQPIINYNIGDGWYVSATTTMSADWEAESGDEWTVPLGGGVGKLVRFGKLPVDFKLMAYSNVEKPEFGPEWTAQFTVKLLLPKS